MEPPNYHNLPPDFLFEVKGQYILGDSDSKIIIQPPVLPESEVVRSQQEIIAGLQREIARMRHVQAHGTAMLFYGYLEERHHGQWTEAWNRWEKWLSEQTSVDAVSPVMMGKTTEGDHYMLMSECFLASHGDAEPVEIEKLEIGRKWNQQLMDFAAEWNVPLDEKSEFGWWLVLRGE